MAKKKEPTAPLDSTDLAERQQIGEEAIERQLEHGPAHEPKRFKVNVKVQGEQREMLFTAQDESDAWAKFCDAAKLPEGLRARKIARPTITEVPPEEATAK